MNHDPLCPTDQNLDPACWFCELINKVRAEEQAKQPDIPTVTRALMDVAIPMIYDMLRAQVMTIPYVLTYGTAEVKRDDVLALLDSDAPVVRCRYCGNVQASASDRVHHEASQHGAVLKEQQ